MDCNGVTGFKACINRDLCFNGKQTCIGMVDELTYRNYAYNRQIKPEITPERWAMIYTNVPIMEKRLQEEIKSEFKQ